MGQMDQAHNANMKMENFSWDIFQIFSMLKHYPVLKNVTRFSLCQVLSLWVSHETFLFLESTTIVLYDGMWIASKVQQIGCWHL